MTGKSFELAQQYRHTCLHKGPHSTPQTARDTRPTRLGPSRPPDRHPEAQIDKQTWFCSEVPTNQSTIACIA
jgi:hypothetical protein